MATHTPADIPFTRILALPGVFRLNRTEENFNGDERYN
jgi:hypothetical protein